MQDPMLRWPGMAVGREHPHATMRGERLYDAAHHPLRFILREGEGDALVVVFASYHLPGKPPRYHYSDVLKDLPMPRLFVLDNHGPAADAGPRPCWYLGENREFTVAEDVHELIAAARDALGLKRVICVGSSKGGYAACYFALTGAYEQAIAG